MFEDAALTEDERLDRLDKVLRHETALQRQIDTAVKLLAKEVPALYKQRLREQVLEDLHITERECRDEPETDLGVSLETSNRLYQLRKATTQAVNELSVAPLDPARTVEDNEICQNEPGTRRTLSPAKRCFLASSLTSRAIHGMVLQRMVPLELKPAIWYNRDYRRFVIVSSLLSQKE